METFVTRLENYLLGLIPQTLSPLGHEDGLRLPQRSETGSLWDYEYDWESRPIDICITHESEEDIDMMTQTEKHQPSRTPVMVTASEDHDTNSEYSSTEEPDIICNVREKRFIKRRGSQGETETEAEDEDDTLSNIVKRRKRTVKRKRSKTIKLTEELIFGMEVTS